MGQYGSQYYHNNYFGKSNIIFDKYDNNDKKNGKGTNMLIDTDSINDIGGMSDFDPERASIYRMTFTDWRNLDRSKS